MSNGNERRECQFHLLRYVPDPVRNEYVHIGVILREQNSPGKSAPEPPRVHFTRDWRRVRCLDRGLVLPGGTIRVFLSALLACLINTPPGFIGYRPGVYREL